MRRSFEEKLWSIRTSSCRQVSGSTIDLIKNELAPLSMLSGEINAFRSAWAFGSIGTVLFAKVLNCGLVPARVPLDVPGHSGNVGVLFGRLPSLERINNVPAAGQTSSKCP